jgi:hypothetical protein
MFMVRLFIVFLVYNSVLFSQIYARANDNSDKTFTVKRSSVKIKLDGILDEETWNEARTNGDFWMKFPVNDKKSEPATEFKVSYDDHFLYVGIKITQTPNGNIVQSLKRDQGLRNNDGVGVVLDPVNLKTNGYYFAVTPFNSQAEALIGDSFSEITFTWDNTWFSKTQLYDGYWTAEIAIPFAIIRHDVTKRTWGINIIRSSRSKNEFHTWTKMPLQFPGTDLGPIGEMNWTEAPPSGGKNISLNPYLLSNVAADKQNNESTNVGGNAGLDAKISLSSSMNLDFTFNPDFSNVDVDQQVTNLTRFSIFFPERRIFFLENEDLFSNFGIPPIRPFYSRRIGSKNGQAVPILFGARLTGNVNKKLRVGAMNIQTGRKDDIPADNYTSVTFNQRVADRSFVSGYFINRTELQNETERLNNRIDAFGRNAGLQAGYNSKNGEIQTWITSHMSFKPGVTKNNFFSEIGGGYFGRNLTSFLTHVNVGKNYYADVGFVNRVSNYDAERDTIIRIGNRFFYNETNYSWYPEKGTFNRITLGTENFLAFDDAYKFNERTNVGFMLMSFRNSSFIRLLTENNKVNLFFPFSFVNEENAKPLPSGIYDFTNLGITFSSDVRKNFVFAGGVKYGKFYSADFSQVTASVIARKQPYFSFNMNAEYNNLRFPAAFGRQKYFLFGPQIEVNFTNNLFWTTFLQWNNQADNFNINSRIQWRYRSMSDVFLVFTDNYFVQGLFANKNRALVLKMNYWLNV